ncbi:MAG TPA: hypothetical protein VNF24_07110, partial [Candidatus Acidoferrales bacterium]|nr:hypothetical protein [Candidatus Acidoferrales bacterium]
EWHLGRVRPAHLSRLLVYLMVDSVADALEGGFANRGAIVQDTPEITARFRKPDGNVIGLYQEPVESPTS